MPATRLASVKATGLGPFGASRARVASSEVPAAQFSSQPGLASALAGMRPARRTAYPQPAAARIVSTTPSMNALNITPRPRRVDQGQYGRGGRQDLLEFPAGYSSAGCSPAEPTSASPAAPVYDLRPSWHNQH